MERNEAVLDNKSLKKEIFWQRYSARVLLLGILLTLLALFSLQSKFFFTFNNIKNILNSASIYLILSVGMTFVIVSGGIDLSMGATLAVSSIAMAYAMRAGAPTPPAIFLGLGVGVLIGLINGLIISGIGINALIVTLSMASIIRGASILVTDGRPIYGFTAKFTSFGSMGKYFINPAIAVSLCVVLIGSVILEHTKIGNYCFILGSSEDALRKTGVSIRSYKMWIFSISGFCAALAGFIVAARLNTAEPLAGSGYEMEAIAAAVLGGTDISGGDGSVSGTFIACLVLAVIRNGLTILAISSNYQMLLTGVIVMVAVGVSEWRKREDKGIF
jgi:ribose/xylose/arabinose/galactoside ABC-type transport system permease subunit